MKKNKIDVIMGYGKIAGKGKIEVTAADGKKQMVEGKYIIIATGAKSRQLPNLPQDGKKIIGYREAMVLPQQPKSMIVVGSGAIGVEFADFYNSMGTKVTIVEFMPRIVPVEDEDISKELEKQLKKKGITILTSSEVTKVDTAGAGVKASVKSAAGESVLEADIVLSAVGIAPNIENIGLEENGIKLEKGKVVVDKTQQIFSGGYLCHWRLFTRTSTSSRGRKGRHQCGRKHRILGEKIPPQARRHRLQQHPRLYLLLTRNRLCWLYRKGCQRRRL